MASIFKYGLNIDDDIDFIPHDNPAAVQSALPADAKVLAIDLRVSEETRACLRSLVDSIFPPGRLTLSEIADGQTDFAGNATNCQIPGDSEVVLAFDFNLVALESDLRMSLRSRKSALRR